MPTFALELLGLRKGNEISILILVNSPNFGVLFRFNLRSS